MSERSAITLVAWRDMRERLRSKAFLASTVLILALVGGSAALARLVDQQTTYRVAVTAPAPPGLTSALQRAAQPFDDADVQLRVVPSFAAGRRALEAEQVDALLLLSDDGSSSAPMSMRRRRPSPMQRCARFAASCRRHRS